MHNEPIKEHLQCGERLLDACGLELTSGQHLDVGGDVLGADVADVAEAPLLGNGRPAA